MRCATPIKMLSELGIFVDITDPKFGGSYRDSAGRALRLLNLPKRETLILVSGYSVEFRPRIRREAWRDFRCVRALGNRSKGFGD